MSSFYLAFALPFGFGTFLVCSISSIVLSNTLITHLALPHPLMLLLIVHPCSFSERKHGSELTPARFEDAGTNLISGMRHPP